MTGSIIKYLCKLPENSLRMFLDIAKAPPAGDPYNLMKDTLLMAHQPSGYQYLEKLFSVPGLSEQKPSFLIADMLELCPRGREDQLFSSLFLQRLLEEMRIVLTQGIYKPRPKQILSSPTITSRTWWHQLSRAVRGSRWRHQEGQSRHLVGCEPRQGAFSRAAKKAKNPSSQNRRRAGRPGWALACARITGFTGRLPGLAMVTAAGWLDNRSAGEN
jgi:hypothetical protein